MLQSQTARRKGLNYDFFDLENTMIENSFLLGHVSPIQNHGPHLIMLNHSSDKYDTQEESAWLHKSFGPRMRKGVLWEGV